jgi:hypothetical protein
MTSIQMGRPSRHKREDSADANTCKVNRLNSNFKRFIRYLPLYKAEEERSLPTPQVSTMISGAVNFGNRKWDCI